MLHPPLPLQSFFPAQELDSGTAHPPLPLQSFFPMQQSLSLGMLSAAGFNSAGAPMFASP
jgi:hypothetical protein